MDGNRTDDDKCSLKEFTSKRREILLINLSIQTQQQQIDSMKADLEKRSMALRQKEQHLDDSMKRFDTFLKDMSQKGNEAAELLDKQWLIKARKERVVKDLTEQLRIVSEQLEQRAQSVA
jgi:vacuolar-type H+-ATPase subunit E/Vma4